MNNPIIANNKPSCVELVEGEEYYFCTCGQSNNQPFCDGTHQGSSFTPLAFLAQKTGEAWLCCCKHSNTNPFCDGTHKQFSADKIGRPGPDQG